MKCPYYKEGKVHLCFAGTDGITVPAPKEVERYCLGESYSKCVVYKDLIRRKEVYSSKEPS